MHDFENDTVYLFIKKQMESNEKAYSTYIKTYLSKNFVKDGTESFTDEVDNYVTQFFKGLNVKDDDLNKTFNSC